MILCWYQVLHSGFQIFFTPSRIKNARGNVTLPLESPTNVGDLNRQRCKIIFKVCLQQGELRHHQKTSYTFADLNRPH